jgi:exopolyphosphatase/pppGpp-phosphohydrolase
MGTQFVIDCGSRSIKLHEAAGGAVSLWATRSWDPINDARQTARVGELLADLTRDIPPVAAIHVVGTAAARRDPGVAGAIAGACKAMGWTYETLSQEAEAGLIRAAFAGQAGCDIIDAGGGSIQIVGADGPVSLLGFGISDLNRMFRLGAEPADRQVRAATDFVFERLPALDRPFVYAGGELSYLRRLGAHLTDAGRCEAREFERVAARADAMTAAELAYLSPFDAAWSRGAVASNAIVRAIFERSGASHYHASDVHIASGIVASIAGRSGDAAHVGL